MVACSLGLAGIAWSQADYRWIYVCLFANGVARAFLQPAKSALLPLIVPRSRFANAVTWSTSGFQLATIVGPALGGLLIAATHSAECVYLFAAPLTLALVVAMRSDSTAAVRAERGATRVSQPVGGCDIRLAYETDARRHFVGHVRRLAGRSDRPPAGLREGHSACRDRKDWVGCARHRDSEHWSPRTS